MDNQSQREREFYERNPLINYLNRSQPRLFRVLWETYLAAKKLRGGAMPLHPVTPILQARTWTPPARPTTAPVQNILFFSFTGWSKHVVLDGLLGQALTMRGADVKYFTCGGILPLCYIHNASSDVPPMPCGRCRAYADSGFQAFGFKPQMIKDLVTDAEWKQVEAELAVIPDEKLHTYERDGIRFGYFASVSTRWFLFSGQIENTPEMMARLRGFLFDGLLTEIVINKLIDQHKPDKILMFNGLHSPEQVVRVIAERHKIPYIATERGYMGNSFFAVHNKACAAYPLDELWQTYKERPLNADEMQRLNTYAQGRRYGQGLMDNLWEKVQDDERVLRESLNLKPDQRIVTAFTNVSGDTAVIDREVAYGSIKEWIDHLIKTFTERPDMTLVFRVHPAETRMKRYRPRELFGRYITETYPNLPPNIKVIPSESTLSSYTLAGISDMIMVYTSTMGLETTLMGKPTTVSAHVHYRNRGFTYDVSTPDDLVKWVDQLHSGTLPPLQLEMAQRYAYLFFFRAMIPLDQVIEETTFGQMRLKINSANDLQPGRIPAVDVLCDSILNGTPFLNPYIEE